MTRGEPGDAAGGIAPGGTGGGFSYRAPAGGGASGGGGAASEIAAAGDPLVVAGGCGGGAGGLGNEPRDDFGGSGGFGGNPAGDGGPSELLLRLPGQVNVDGIGQYGSGGRGGANSAPAGGDGADAGGDALAVNAGGGGGVFVDPSGQIYVSNAGDNSISAFAPDPTATPHRSGCCRATRPSWTDPRAWRSTAPACCSSPTTAAPSPNPAPAGGATVPRAAKCPDRSPGWPTQSRCCWAPPTTRCGSTASPKEQSPPTR